MKQARFLRDVSEHFKYRAAAFELDPPVEAWDWVYDEEDEEDVGDFVQRDVSLVIISGAFVPTLDDYFAETMMFAATTCGHDYYDPQAEPGEGTYCVESYTDLACLRGTTDPEALLRDLGYEVLDVPEEGIG